MRSRCDASAMRGHVVSGVYICDSVLLYLDQDMVMMAWCFCQSQRCSRLHSEYYAKWFNAGHGNAGNIHRDSDMSYPN